MTSKRSDREIQQQSKGTEENREIVDIALPVHLAEIPETKERDAHEVRILDARGNVVLEVAVNRESSVPRAIEFRVAQAFAQDLVRQMNEVHGSLVQEAENHVAQLPQGASFEFEIRARRQNHGRTLADWKMLVHVLSRAGARIASDQRNVDTMSSEEDARNAKAAVDEATRQARLFKPRANSAPG